MRRSLLAWAAIALTALSAGAADNPFAGTWKLDPAKSSYAGFTIAYSKLDNGSYHFSPDGGPGFDIGFEGKEYNLGGGYTISQTMVGDNGWDSVWKLNGKVTSNDHGQISADGKTLTIVMKSVRPDGSTVIDENIYTRLSGTSGPAGEWKQTARHSPQYTMIVSSTSEGVLRWELPEYKQIIEGKLDGSDLSVTGPQASPGQTEALTIKSPSKIAYTDKMGGKPTGMGV